MQKYVFRPHQNNYQQLFEQEKQFLSDVLNEKDQIEHIGSTAVPGLGGKGIIDIMIAVDKTELTEMIAKLQSKGYDYKEHASFPDRLFFQKDYLDNGQTRRVHVHVTYHDSNEWRDKLALRDYWRTHPEEIEIYARIKSEAAELAQGDKEIYREHKKKYLDDLIRRIG